MSALREVVASLRWAWRQLTAMRTALILLLLLALASIPGSLLPQRGTSPLKVRQYLRDHGTYARVLDKLHFFDVFASPWFAAVYLLLFISLVGCIVPRTINYAREIGKPPSTAPTNLQRLAGYQTWTDSHAVHTDSLNAVSRAWRAKGWRVRVEQNSLAAEKGLLREIGNLLFHMSLLALLVAVGLGSARGFKGTVIVREGSGFANNVTQYDTFTPGRAFDTRDLSPFSFTLNRFSASYQVGGMQNGAARSFEADVTFQPSPSAESKQATIEVNKPLRVAGNSIYLVGHGYAPEFALRDRKGRVVWQDAAVFLPQDGNFTSQGVVKAPDAVPQIGIQGFFLPTATKDLSRGPRSTFPAPNDPQVYLSAWVGDLGLDSGTPQSVYTLQTDAMKRIGIEELKPGEKWVLPDKSGTLEFTGYRQWASFSITRDTGKGWALGAGMLAIMGLSLSLTVPHRRLWLRATSATAGTVWEVAGLSKTEAPGVVEEIARLAAVARTTLKG